MRGREEGQLPQREDQILSPRQRGSRVGDRRGGPPGDSGTGRGCRASPGAGPGGGGSAGGRAGRQRRLLPQPWAAGGAGGGVALKGAGATGVGTSARVGLSRRIRWGRGKPVASPRGQNQEESQMEEENRSPGRRDRNFCGEVGDGGGFELEDLG